MPAGRKRISVGSVKPRADGTMKLHSPKSPRDWRAWYESPRNIPCPEGTHRARAYKNIHSPRKYCLRDCDAWNPAKREVGKKGRCARRMIGPVRQSAWQLVLADHREAARDMIAKTPSAERKTMMQQLMKNAAETYNNILGKGASVEDYMAKRDLVLADI